MSGTVVIGGQVYYKKSCLIRRCSLMAKYRSPKPYDVGSSPTTLANKRSEIKIRSKCLKIGIGGERINTEQDNTLLPHGG